MNNIKGLILEDDLVFSKILELRLKSWHPDIELKWARTIKELKIILSSDFQPTFAILDQNLPDGLGHDQLLLFEQKKIPTLAVSSDDSPELPGVTLKKGAAHFLAKRQISQPFFIPLLQALVERADYTEKNRESELANSRIETIGTLVATLQHEIFNPLGAVIGATKLLSMLENTTPEQQEMLDLINSSSKRIQKVLEDLSEATNLELVEKGGEMLFHLPKDPEWKR